MVKLLKKRTLSINELFWKYLDSDYSEYETAMIVERLSQIRMEYNDVDIQSPNIFKYMCKALQDFGFSCDEWVEYYFNHIK